MGKSSCYDGSHDSCYCYWPDSCGFSIVGRSYAIAKITIREASANVACVAVAAVSVLDARTVTESFADVVKYLSGEIHLEINTILRQSECQLYSRIRTSLELNCAPFGRAVVQIDDRRRSLHLV